MLIDEMHYEFDLRLDRVASQDRPDFYDNEKDAYLRRGILKWVKERYGTDNPKKLGFETSQERISNLMTLHIKYPVQPLLTPTSVGNGIYELRLTNLAFPYFCLTHARVTIAKGNCTKKIDSKNWQIDDKKNSLNEPNFEWGRILANFGKSTLVSTVNKDLASIYFDTTDYDGVSQYSITSVELAYIKMPNKVCIGTYKDIGDKTPALVTPVTQCDIDEAFHEEIVDFAVALAAKDIQDQFGYQAGMQQIENNK